MTVTKPTVNQRIEEIRVTLSPTQIALILTFAAATVFTLLFMQEPLVHDSLHNFRHSVGVTCH